MAKKPQSGQLSKLSITLGKIANGCWDMVPEIYRGIRMKFTTRFWFWMMGMTPFVWYPRIFAWCLRPKYDRVRKRFKVSLVSRFEKYLVDSHAHPFRSLKFALRFAWSLYGRSVWTRVGSKIIPRMAKIRCWKAIEEALSKTLNAKLGLGWGIFPGITSTAGR